MRLTATATATAIAIALLLPASAQAALTAGTGGAPVPAGPHTGGAPATQPVRPLHRPESAPERPEGEAESLEGEAERRGGASERPKAARRAAGEGHWAVIPSAAATADATTPATARIDVAPIGQAVVAQQEDSPDRDVEVPVPERQDEPRIGPSPVVAADDDSPGLARAGLDVVPLAALGLASMLAGLTALRPLSRRRPG